MPPKDAKKGSKPTSAKISTYAESEQSESLISPRNVSLVLTLIGDAPGPGDATFLAVFNRQIVLDGKWHNGRTFTSDCLPINLKDQYFQDLCANTPLILIVRIASGKGVKDPDPLLNTDNRAGATVDLFPLVLGQEQIFTQVTLLLISTGENTNSKIQVNIVSHGTLELITRVPLLLTMISAHCLPYTKEGTVYLAGMSLDNVCEDIAINFGMSLSNSAAEKLIWATASNGGYAANTAFNVPNEDKFIPQDFETSGITGCNCMYWNAMTRVLVDPVVFRNRLASPFFIELAGVPRAGKIDVRGRYMAFIDAKVLLEPGEYGVTTCARLLYYNESDVLPGVGALLDLPPTSAKAKIVRESAFVSDDFGHPTYIIVRLDLTEPLTAKTKIVQLFQTLGLQPSDGPLVPVEELEAQPTIEDYNVDVRRIRKEGGALAVHKELSGLACRGAVPMNQGIKRTAANRLLMRVRTMLKQFSPPDNCSEIEWQDIVSGQHAASRRAVTSSFAPQPPPQRQPAKVAAARCQSAGDSRLAAKHIKTNLKVAGTHPRSLLSKAIRCLEERNDSEAKTYILDGLKIQARNRYLLWIYGAQEFDKGPDAIDAATAAFRISVKGDISEGTANAIGWAALHAIHHSNENNYAAFVAVKKMRKSYELVKDWKKLIQRWVETSGQEEIFWTPTVISHENPMIIAAAFFLCLRCYIFSERLLRCFEEGCSTRGSRTGLNTKITCDVYYLRAASLILRRQLDKGLEIIDNGIKRFGPSAVMSQMRVTCLMCLRGWDGKCEDALQEAERAGAETCPGILLKAALSGINLSPKASLQRAARAHKIAPSGHSALVIGRIYAKLGEDSLAERWTAAAVKLEPFLADGWAFLCLLAMCQRNPDKARAMLRTARQVGPVSPDIEEELKRLKNIVQIETMPDTLVKKLCLCDYYI